MLNLARIREFFPQYEQVTDYELTRAAHAKEAPDMPFERFAAEFGGPTVEDERNILARDYNVNHPDAPIRPEEIGEGSFVNDMGHAVAAGLNDMASLPFWLGEKFMQGIGMDWAAGQLGKGREYFTDSAEEKRRGYSADMKLARDKEFITHDDESGYGLGDAWTSPRAVLGTVAESLPSMVGGMGIGAGIAKGLMKRGVSRALAWGIGSSIGEGSVGGAQNSMGVYDAVMKMPEETLAQSPEYQELLKELEPDAARRKLADRLALAAGVQTGASTAALSAPAGAMFGKMLGGETGKTLARSMLKMGVAEAGEEMLQSGAEEYLSQRQVQRADPSIDPWKGVPNATVAGGIAGFTMGAGLGPIGHYGGRRARETGGNDNLSQPDKGAEAEEFISEADARDISDFVREQEASAAMEDDIALLTGQTQPWSHGGQLALDRGETVDLLGLPQQAGLQTAQGIGGLVALPEGTGAIPMGSESTGRGSIAPSTDFSTPVAASYQPRVGLPAGGQGNAIPGSWAGLHSQRASTAPQFAGGQALDMAQGIGGVWSLAPGQQAGNIGGAPSVQSSPATGGGGQLAPRADTQAPAQALGMPAPNPQSGEAHLLRQGKPAVLVPPQRQGQIQGQEQAPINSEVQTEQDVPVGAEIKLMRGPKLVFNIKTGQQELLRPGGYATYTKVSKSLWVLNRQANGAVEAFVEDPKKIDEIESAWKKENPSHPSTYEQKPGDAGAKATTAKQTEERRAGLLQQLPPESRREARRLTNAQLRERVRAEQNPVKFDGENIDYTVEDHPMPTAPSGTVFISGSGRRLSPFPQVDYSTPRKHRASNAKVAAWLLDEARKEAAPNEWRSLLISGTRADNLSPADVRDLVDILSDGVREEAIPPLFKAPQQERVREHKAQEMPEAGVTESAVPTSKVESEKKRAGEIFEPEKGASVTAVGVVKSEKTALEKDHGRVHDGEPGDQPMVDEPVDLAAGLQPGSRPQMVEQSKSREASRASGRDGGAGSLSGRDDGRDASGRKAGNARGGDLSDGRGGSGRRDAGRNKVENSGLGGELGTSELSGRERKNGDNHRPVKPEAGDNHRIAEGDVLVPRGASARAKANIDAIRLVKRLEQEGRPATPEEKKILTQFTGWGSLAQTVFNPDFVVYARMEGRGGGLPPYLNADTVAKYRKWKSQYGEVLHPDLGGLLTEKEWAAAEKSTLNAHYTDRNVISAMWEMAEKLGFRGGRVLEPSAGTGLFFGLMPEGVARNSALVGVELDELTGKILKHLYPDADIQISGFEKAKRLGDNTVDLVISNVPFGDFTVFDKARPQYNKQSIHNYFFSRALDTVRPGGLVMQITSHFTLDSGSAAKLREEWSRKADLVAAVRLPGTAFEKNAGTEVTTDILIFRKKTDSDFALGQPFRNLSPITTKQGETRINEYFVAHPEMVLGEHSLSGTMYGGNEYTLLPAKGESLEDGLRRATENIPADVYGIEARNTGAEQRMTGETAREGAKEGSLVDEGGKGIFLVVDGRLEAPEWAGNKRQVEQARAYVGVKDAALRLISAMNSDPGDQRVNALRKELNDVYDAYVKKHGPINKSGNGFLEDDIEFPTVAALEMVTQEPGERMVKSGPNKGKKERIFEKKISKADIFTTRTIFPFHAPEHAESPEDAVKISRIYKNRIDLPYIAGLLGMEPNEAKAALLKTGEVFENPESGLLEPRDMYLSGNVREKLARAERAAVDNPGYEVNVAALREVQPPRIGIDAIFSRLGSAWMPPEVYEAFLRHIGVGNAKVTLARLPGDEGTATWSVRGGGLSAEARNRWGTERANVLSLIEDCLNLKRTAILDPVEAGGKKKYVRNDKETLAAQEKQRLLQEEFAAWLVGSEHAQRVEDVYNEKFNGFVVRTFDVPDIKYYPGASHSIELRDNQKVGVSRALQESCLLAHGVGSGKTMLEITLAMEMRRLGTARKPWIVVQGATLAQFAASFKALYPGARILAPTETQRSAANRRRLLAQIASGDWDAVITPHGFFNGVSVAPETEARFIQEQVDEYESLLLTIDKDEKVTRKQIEKKIERLKVRLENLADTRKDENIFFDELGVDALIIDEGHAYKRGQFVSKMDNVKGLDRDSSQRSFQMLMKARLVQAKTGGKNVVMATGTPISNTLTEMWTMFRYTRPDLLREFGVEQFDDFATTFAATSISQEETATGEWKDVERFNKYVNGPELLTLWRSGADVAITEDLTSIKGLPKLQGGKIHEVSVERSEALSNYIEALRQERIAWDNLSGKEKREKSHVPLTIYGRAKQAAIDLRLVDSTLHDEQGSKANTAVRNIFERWQANQDAKATQIVFSDTFQSKDKAFNLFADIKHKLVALGVPEREIAIIHDYKSDESRKKLFDAVNRGDVRVLMGTTEKLGVGVNVQERLLTAHHLDAPQRPMDFEQRNGRIRRPGNIFPEVEILTYGTKNTLDSVTFQQLISKQKFINQLLRGNVSDRSFENPFDATQATFEDMMAAFSGNPLAKEKMQLTAEVRRLRAMLSSHAAQVSGQRSKLRALRSALERQEDSLPERKKLTEYIKHNFPKGKIEGRKEIAKEIGAWLDPTEAAVAQSVSDIQTSAQWYTKNRASFAKSRDFDLGHGLRVTLTVEPYISFAEEKGEQTEYSTTSAYRLQGPHDIRQDGSFNGAQGLFTRLGNVLSTLEGSQDDAEARLKDTRAQIATLEEEIDRPFAQQKELETAVTRLEEVEKELEAATKVKKENPAQEESDGEVEPPLVSLAPGKYLPSRRKTRLHLRPAAVQRVVDALGKTAKNAAPVRVVQTAEELPARVREMFADQLDAIEGIYDPASGVVWMVADNISDMGRAAEVWAHEQVGHHGLRGLFSDGERRRLLNSLWLSMGGMGNETIRRVAEEYGLKPRTVDADRQTVMEEVIAHLAEKRQGGRLDAKEQNLWRKIVNAVLRAWKKVMNAVSGREGRMAHENIDALLADLGSFVWEGRGAREAFGFGQPGAGVFAAKRGEAEETVRYQKARSKDSPNDLVLLPDGSADFGVMPETKLRDGRVLKGAPIRLQRGISRFGGGYGYEHINDVHGDEIRDAGYPGVQAFVWELVHNYNQIWQESNGALRFVKEAGSGRSAGFVRLTRRGDFYEIRSAFPMVNSPSVRGGKLLWAGDPHQSTATEEQNPFVTKSDRLAPTARTGSEGSLRSQRGQSNEKSIMQVRDADKPLASLSKKSDRENLNELISEWNRRTGLKKEVLLRQLRDYFNVKSIDEIPGKWKGDAEAFVQEKIRDIPDPDKAGFLDRLITLDMRKTAALTDVPEIRSFFHEKDLGMMSNFLSLPHWIAKRIPAFAKVYERQLRRMDERSAALKNSLEQVPSLFGKNRMGKKDMESLGKILWETEGKEPKELEGVEKFLTSDKLANGRELIEINPDFYKAYEKWVSGLNGTEAAKKALVEVRKSLDNDLALAHNRMAAMSELSDDAIKQFRQDIGHIPNYFPHHRYGKYFVQAKVGDEVVFRQHFDAATKARAMLEAKRIAAEQAKNFPGATWSRGDNVRLPDEVLGAPIDTEAMEQIIRAATAKITDKGHAKEIAELLMEGTADVLKARGWGEHGIRRKGVPGFERKDLARILYDYKAGLNGWLTKMEAARDFGDALREIDALQTPRLWKYASQYVRDMLRNRDDIDRMTGMIKSVAFAWYMGGSIKTAMVNLTQNIVVGIPRLQMDVTGGAGAWIRGAHKAIAHRVTGSRSGLLAEEEARLLHELDGENVITDAYMEEIRGQLGSTPRNLWNRFTKVLGWPMSEVERFNRASLALAAFRAARAGQMKPHARVKYGVRGKASYEQAKSFAADVVKDAHFVYGKSNTPEFLRSNAAGRAAGSMFTFRSFTFNMLGMWLWALRTQGREGAVFAAKSLGATMALGGVTALPFYATAMALCQMMSGDDDDWTEQIRQSLPQNNLLRDMVCYGMPSMAGINIGGSLQMETGLTRGLQRGVTPKEILAESFGDIIGIPYDLAIEKTSKVMEASRHGDVWRMVEEAAPVALKNTMQAWRLMTEGQTAMSGRPINNPGEHGARKLTGAEAVGKALGFQPVSSTKSYAAYAARQHAEKVKGDMLDELAVLALRSHDTGTPDGKLEMRKRMRVWNAKMEAEGKPDMIIREKDVIRRVKARRRENRVTPKAMRERERQQAVWG